jgi:cytochrome c553
VYTTKQLSDYASDARYGKDDKGRTLGSANATIMNTIASRLTAQDRSNLSAYLQGMR